MIVQGLSRVAETLRQHLNVAALLRLCRQAMPSITAQRRRRAGCTCDVVTLLIYSMGTWKARWWFVASMNPAMPTGPDAASCAAWRREI